MSEQFLAVGPDEVGVARAWARRQVERFPWPLRWRPDPEAVVLVVSELVTNALRHVGGTAGLWLIFGARRLRIVVSDDSPTEPVQRPPLFTGGGGWGMHIVAALTQDVGTARSGHGKQVWADITDVAAIAAPRRLPLEHAAAPAYDNQAADTAGHGCFSCSPVVVGKNSAAPVRSSRFWTWLLTLRRRTLPWRSKAALRA